MHRTTLMLDLKNHEIAGLMTLCKKQHREKLAELCQDSGEISALMSALDELTWQLASNGCEGAIEQLVS